MNLNKLLLLTLLGILTVSSCKKDDETEEPANIVIEVTRFNLNAGVDASTFQTRDAEIEQDFTSAQPGFLKRMSAVDANGKYASIEAFGMDTTVGDYFAMIDTNTFGAERYTSLVPPDINFTLIQDNVIEVTTFNINSGVETAAFETRDTEIEADFTSLQPGFIRRTSSVDANGKYAVVVFWESLADADASIAAFGMDASVADYFDDRCEYVQCRKI